MIVKCFLMLRMDRMRRNEQHEWSGPRGKNPPSPSPQGRGNMLDVNIYDLSLHVIVFKLTF
jgi:hypothetical protein